MMSTTSTLRSVRLGGSLCRRPSAQNSQQWSVRSTSPADCEFPYTTMVAFRASVIFECLLIALYTVKRKPLGGRPQKVHHMA